MAQVPNPKTQQTKQPPPLRGGGRWWKITIKTKLNPIFGNLLFDYVFKLSLPARPHETGHTRVCPRRWPAPLPRVGPVPPAGPLPPAAPLCPPPGHKCAKSSRQAGSPCQPASVNSRELTTRVDFPRGGNSVHLIRFAQQVHREATRMQQGGLRRAPSSNKSVQTRRGWR